jgi:hypothetical protein
VTLSRIVRMSALKSWAMAVPKWRRLKTAGVAVARKLGVILHRIKVDGTSSGWLNETTALA